MDRLEKDYPGGGIKLKVFTKAKIGLVAAVRGVDAVVVFTGKTSHRIRNEAIRAAKSGGHPCCHVPFVRFVRPPRMSGTSGVAGGSEIAGLMMSGMAQHGAKAPDRIRRCSFPFGQGIPLLWAMKAV
jgi:hypothetical protein